MRRLLVVLATLLSGVAMAAPAAEAAPAAADLGGGSTLFHVGDPTGAACTAAFAATGSGGAGYLIAAGPGCGDSGTLYSGSGVVEVGPVVASYPDGIAIVQVTNTAAWTLVPWIDFDAPFDGVTDPVVGAPVCVVGPGGTGGCGAIQAVDISITYPGGVVNGIVATDVHADPAGDAVTFVSGSRAEGVLVGGDTVSSYFHPVVRLLADYGLTLLT